MDEKKPILSITARRGCHDDLRKAFEANGYHFRQLSNCQDALTEIRRGWPAAILVDASLVAKGAIIREHLPLAIPVILIHPFEEPCAQDECDADLEAGFDFAFCSRQYRELVARIRSMSRRRSANSAPLTRLGVGNLVMDLSRYEVTVAGVGVELTSKEFQILRQLLLHPGVVLSRRELLDRIWGDGYALEDHVVDVHISSIRRKVERDLAHPQVIGTIRGAGFKIIVK